MAFRLQLRSPVGLIYTYLLPALFLVAFWAYYRRELVSHLGEVLTVTLLSGACFGLPMTLVDERERGIWRRYRLLPVPLAGLLVATMITRYLILLTAAALQIVLARALGAPLPSALFDVWLAVTIVAAAFLGLGLLLATLANTVTAAQALGQTVFLPLLVIGGVVVPVAALPDWAQHAAAFLPGRYAVDLLRGTTVGTGVGLQPLNAAAAIVVGVTGTLAGLMLFRWDVAQRIRVGRRVAAGALVMLGCVVIGFTAESTDVAITRRQKIEGAPSHVPVLPPGGRPTPPSSVSAAPPAFSAAEAGESASPLRARPPSEPPPPVSPAAAASRSPRPPAVPAPPPPALRQRTWRDVTRDDIEVNLVFSALPPDHGVVSPINHAYRPYAEIECVRTSLKHWAPALIDDLVQRVRNVLLIPAVADVLQSPFERDIPVVIFDHLTTDIPRDQLIQVLYWLATHQADGELVALDAFPDACLPVSMPDDTDLIRERVTLYATKLLGRLIGKRD